MFLCWTLKLGEWESFGHWALKTTQYNTNNSNKWSGGFPSQWGEGGCATSPVRSVSWKILEMIHHSPKETQLVRKQYYSKDSFSMTLIWAFYKICEGKLWVFRSFESPVTDFLWMYIKTPSEVKIPKGQSWTQEQGDMRTLTEQPTQSSQPNPTCLVLLPAPGTFLLGLRE